MRQIDSKMVEFDPGTMSETNSFIIPRAAFDGRMPPKVHVNSTGQVLILTMQSPKILFFWDGAKASTIEPDFSKVAEIPYHSNGPLLAADGKSYFFIKNKENMTYTPNPTVSPEKAEEYKMPSTVDTTIQVFQKSLLPEKTKEAPKVVIERSLGFCRCTTGACEESCPVGRISSPVDIVDNFLIIDTFVAGQTRGHSEGFFKYQFNGKTWSDSKIVGKFDNVLAVRKNGEEIIASNGGGGCCGWANQSNQIVTLQKSSGESEIYNQYKENNNADYDIFFANVTNLFNPSGKYIAMRFNEYHGNCESSEECAAALKIDPAISIRRRDEKKIDLNLLTSLVKAIPRYPITRIVLSDAPKTAPVEFEQTVPVGWLSEDMLLVYSKEKAKIFHVSSKKLEELPIKVFKESMFVSPNN